MPPTDPTTNEAANASIETVTIQVEGMHCSACEAPIRAALQQTPGVRNVDVSYKRGDARVEFDPKRTSVEQIKRAINSTGYKAK
jgi:copper chaperone CopZ